MPRAWVRMSMFAYERLLWRPLERSADAPAYGQRAVLANLLAKNKKTRFGIEHGFSSIHDPDQFRTRVPVQDYEQLRPYIDDQRRTGRPALTLEMPAFYAQTSGTTGAPKHIPITRTVLALYRREQALFSYLQYRACPAAFEGKAWGIMGAPVEGLLDTGHVVGSVSGHLYRSLPRMVRRRFVIPPDVAGEPSYELKYLTILRLALSAPTITYIGAPNPSTFLRLLHLLNEQRDALGRSVANGTFDQLDALEPSVREMVRQRLRASPTMADRLVKRGDLTFADVWPGIRLLTTWTGGSCGIALERLRATLPRGTAVMELGYLSSEFRGSLALTAETSGGLPPLTHHFFEFVEQDAWDRGRPVYRMLDDLELGRLYYVIITTTGGLYRYFMNDLVEVTGMFRRTPLIKFVQKGKGVTSITGEKLYEAQAIESVRAIASVRGLAPAFFMMVADEPRSGYRLFIEVGGGHEQDRRTLAADIDERLGQLNIEYHSKRASGRLHPLDLVWLRQGTGEAFKATCLRAGQRDGQFKPMVLQYRKDLAFPFDQYAVS